MNERMLFRYILYCRCIGNVYDVKDGMKVSVIISFFNETQINLFKTILSVVNKTTRKYLKEIIVIDDCSFDGKYLFYYSFIFYVI